MQRVMRVMLGLFFATATGLPAAAAPEPPPEPRFPAAASVPTDAPLFLLTADLPTVWEISRMTDRPLRRDDGRTAGIEFTCLARFRDYWYISFREGYHHQNDPDGRGRVIRSADGLTWESVGLFESNTGDVRDPRLSVTSDGQLMVNSSVAFVPFLPLSDVAPPEVVDGIEVTRRSVTWLSDDGENWQGPFFCPTGINTWRWSVTWHDGYGYSAGYSGKDRPGTLYRTRDGKTWKAWHENFFPPPGPGDSDYYNEATFAFGSNGTAWCLLRGGRGGREATLGSAPPPYDRDWTWRKLDVAWHGSDYQRYRRAYSETRANNLGGPTLITLADGRLLAIARADGTGIFLVDPRQALMTRLVSVQIGGSYPSMVEHEGEIWFSRCVGGSGVSLGRVRIPARATLADLLAAADEFLVRPAEGFGAPARRALAGARRRAAETPDEPRREELDHALADYRTFRAARENAAALLARAFGMAAEPAAGFEARARAAAGDAAGPLEQRLADEATAVADIEAAVAHLAVKTAAARDAARLCAAAEAALAAAAGLPAEPAPGYHRLYRDLVARRADLLRQVLSEDAAESEAVEEALGRLREAQAELLESSAFPAAPEIAADGVPARVRPEAGLLVNTRAEDTGLRLADEPVLAFTGERFDGSWVDFGNPPEIVDLGEVFTVSAWVYPKSTEFRDRTILLKGSGPSGGYSGFYLRQARTEGNRHDRNRVTAGVYGIGEPLEPYEVRFQPRDRVGFDNRWHHYALTFDGARLTLWVDGEPVGDAPAFAGEANLSGGELTAGRERWSPMHGFIQDIRISDTALGPDGIRAAMSRRPAPGQPELVAWWPLDEGAGDRAHDRAGGENHGTIHRAEWRTVRARAGRRVSGPFRFPDVARVAGSRVDWRFEDGGDPAAAACVLVGWSGRPDALPDEWREAENGEPVPGLELGGDPRGKWLWLREEIFSPDPAADPALRDVAVTVE